MAFSFSQLQLYQTCPRQYEFATVKKIPRAIRAGESFGSSMHNTLARWGKLEMEHGSPAQQPDQLDLFGADAPEQKPELTINALLEYWHQSFIIEGYENKEDADYARRTGERILRMYLDWWKQSEREVVAIEKGFSLAVDHHIVKGRFDRVERDNGGLRVIDYKTGSVRTQQQVDDDLQLSIYAMACQEVFKEPCAELVLLFLREDGITEVRTVRSSADLNVTRERIDSTAAGIDNGDFHPEPSPGKCQHCPYRGICDAAEV